MTRFRAIVALLTLACISTAGGCGGRYPCEVSGQVTLDGEPVPTGERVRTTITFFPTAEGSAAYAVVDDNARYRVQTGGQSGLAAGEYKVSVEITELEPPPAGGYENAPGFRFLSPPVYADRSTTPLRAVVEPGANEIDLQLETEAGSEPSE